jgi:uncharacterized membrane protein
LLVGYSGDVTSGDVDGDPILSPTATATKRRTWRRALDETFRASLVLKGIDGALELIGGLLLLVVSPTTMDRMAKALFQHELSEDPNDFFARHVLHVTANLHATRTFGAVYLLAHGVAKLVMVIGLWKHQRWAYPFALVFLIAFIVYQLYRMTFAPSTGLAFLTVFDVFVVWLVWRDYGEHRRRTEGRSFSPAPSA